jgi:flavin-dependent dehydrogenase
LFSKRLLDFIPESEKLVKNEIEYAVLNFPQKKIKLNFSKKFLVMKHEELDRLVAEKAKDSGVKIALSKEIEYFPQNFDRIIGADGANSKTRKLLGVKEPEFRLGIQGFIKKRDNSKFVETWPTASGFLWKIPRGKEIEYGIIERPSKADRMFKEFVLRKKLNLQNISAAPISQGLVFSENEKIALCGDAAGLTKPWSGGGVIWGLVASDILLKNFPDFLKYKKELKVKFFPKFVFSKIATEAVYFFGFKMPFFLPSEAAIESDFLV